MKKVFIAICFSLPAFAPLGAQILYGTTTPPFSVPGYSTINKFDATTNTLTIGYKFEEKGRNPNYSQLVQASNDKMYGMTVNGGDRGDYGVIFSFDPVTNAYTKLYDFDGTNGSKPRGSLLQASNGKLYGMTDQGGSSNKGVIFSFDPSANTYTKLYDFDGTNGANPHGSLTQASNGKLYGMTYGGGSNGYGVVFSFNVSTNTYAKLHDFVGADGANPYGSLIQASDGNLYGMTYFGGSSNNGVIFTYNLDPNAINPYANIHDFNGTSGRNPPGSLIQASNGKLYGLTSGSNGVLFSFNLPTGTYTKLFQAFDGGPTGSLIQASNGKLYGLTSDGGANFIGVIFSFDPSANAYAKLYDFDGINGGNSFNSLIQASNGELYGTTGGGSSGYGVIFSFSPTTNSYTKLFQDFDYANGFQPEGGLVQATNSKLYGMTYYGGFGTSGVIFNFDPSTNIYTKLYDLDGTDGDNPVGGLIQASDDKLYGMTASGGIGVGVIFSFDPSTNTYTKLYDFDGANGRQPSRGLMQASNGKLYGTTLYGGSSGYGVIFSFDPSTNTYTKLYDFDGTNGGNASANLMQATSGKLYGVTAAGGSGGYGVLFSFDPITKVYAKVYDFNGTNGRNPIGRLVQASNGKLYGTAIYGGTGFSGGFSGYGLIFSLDPTNNIYAKVYDFDSTNGRNPTGGLMQAANGKFYGVTYYGGSNNKGVIFSFDPATSSYAKLKDFDGTNVRYPNSGFIELKTTTTPTTWNLAGNSAATPSSILGTTNSIPLNLITNSVTRMYIGTNGKVGIGTSSALTLLHVVGSGSFGNSVTSANATRALNLADTAAIVQVLRVDPTNAPAVELISRKGADSANVAYWDFYAQPSDASFRIRDRQTGSNLDRVTISHATGNVGIGTVAPNATAMLDLSSTAKGMLVPRMTQVQRNAIASPPQGLLVFQTDNAAGFYYYDSGWKLLNSNVATLQSASLTPSSNNNTLRQLKEEQQKRWNELAELKQTFTELKAKHQ